MPRRNGAVAAVGGTVGAAQHVLDVAQRIWRRLPDGGVTVAESAIAS